MKVYLLYPDQDFDFEADLPSAHQAENEGLSQALSQALNQALREDLELPRVLSAMAGGDAFLEGVATTVLLHSLDAPDTIRYRQEILADCLSAPESIRAMYAIAVDALEDRRQMWGYNSEYPSVVLSGAVNQLEASFARLKQLRTIADANAPQVHSDGLKRLFTNMQQELDDEYLAQIRYHLETLQFRQGTLISAELDRDNSPINLVLRKDPHEHPSWKERLGIHPRTSHSFTVAANDDWGQQALADLVSRGINLVANAVAQSADHILSYFTVLRAELGFYVACLNLRDQLAAREVPVSFPDPRDWSALQLSLSMEALRDIALILRGEDAVVGNDVNADGRSLVIITGANSGGKTTFLRSVGLAQLMMQCGLFVTAKSYRANVCRGIFTHFGREEDATMTSGRLDGELRRMSAIADAVTAHGLVLLNESFSTTNELEGSEIGRQVVGSLLDEDIKVVFVTHQFDLAESFYKSRPQSTLFLRAERATDDRKKYQLTVAAPLPTSFGEDLYYRYGRWLHEADPSEAREPATPDRATDL